MKKNLVVLLCGFGLMVLPSCSWWSSKDSGCCGGHSHSHETAKTAQEEVVTDPLSIEVVSEEVEQLPVQTIDEK